MTASKFATGASVPLESVLCTEELTQRPSRLADYEAENRALVALAQSLADSPRTILQSLAQTILDLLQADSAGVSLLTDDEKSFHWPAIAGMWNRTSVAGRRAILDPAAMCSIATPRSCSGGSNGVTPISNR